MSIAQPRPVFNCQSFITAKPVAMIPAKTPVYIRNEPTVAMMKVSLFHQEKPKITPIAHQARHMVISFFLEPSCLSVRCPHLTGINSYTAKNNNPAVSIPANVGGRTNGGATLRSAKRIESQYFFISPHFLFFVNFKGAGAMQSVLLHLL